MASTFEQLVDDLARDVTRAQPRDIVQFCTTWFNTRLEEQRVRMRDALASNPAFSDLFDDSGPSNPAQSGNSAALMKPRPSVVLDGTPVLKNPFGPQSQLHTYAPPVHPPTAGKRAFGSIMPFVTIHEDEALSPTSFANPFATQSIQGGLSQGPFDGSPFDNPSPFGNMNGGSPFDSGSNNSNDAGLIPPSLLGRRVSVSAESITPSALTPTQSTLPYHHKDPQQLSRIKTSISANFIFRDVEEKQMGAVLNAMEEFHVRPGEIVIRQGDHGDYFYVVEEGTLYVYITSDPSNIPSNVSREQALPSGDGLEGFHHLFGKKVAENTAGSSFGELALMYGHPRAATVLAVVPCTLWRLDRVAFRTIILKAAHGRRSMYEDFLKTVPLLAGLAPEERSKVADALVSSTVEDGEAVVREGEMGDMFYFVEEGTASVRKRVKEGEGVGEEREVNVLKKGDYFGELALLRLEPRAATIRAVVRSDPSDPNTPPLKVAALGVAAFTRLLGPMRDIMERKAGDYGGTKVLTKCDRVLVDVINLAKACYLKLAGPSLVQMFIGDGAKLVRDAFNLAKEKAPAIIFIDELDAVGTKRFDSDKSGDREVQRTMLELLNQLDGFSSDERIKVIAATNRIDILDPALLRSGRLDRNIEFPLPTEEGRAQILRIHSRKMTVGPGINFEELARSTDEFNGAQLKAVCVEAGMIALREGASQLNHEHFHSGIAEVQSKKKNDLMYFA